MNTDLQALQFIGGDFIEWEPPRERLYVFRYFRTQIEKAFIRYYYCFGSYEYFTTHTGHYCQKRWLKILLKRHDAIIAAHDEAKKTMDLALLARIEKGKYKLSITPPTSGEAC